MRAQYAIDTQRLVQAQRAQTRDFADSTAVALDIELLTPPVASRLSPALPAVEQLLD